MLNELTKCLFSEGYTRDNHPDSVYWSDYENFGYKWETLLQMCWRTPCGLLVDGRTVGASDVSYGGISYCPENGNPVIRCPYSRRDCEHQSGALAKYCMCVCSRSDACFDYEKSAEKVEKERDKESHRKYLEITGGQYCACVVGCNGYEPGRYEIDYDPERCIQLGCKNEICSVTKKERDLSKCNVFYDIRREWLTRNGIIEDHKIAVEKGCKVFPKPIARTDAELWLARQKSEFNPFREKSIINPHLTSEDRSMQYFSDHHRQWPGYDYFEFRYSVENIRIEAREARDLLQDLRDVAEGLEVVHASDMEKAKTQAKRNARTKRAAEKQKRIEKNHRKAFDEHWNDPTWKRTLQIFFGAEYDRMIREKQDELVGVGAQLSLFPEL